MPLTDGTIYLDHAATTPTDPVVLERMLPYFTELFGNPSSIYALGRKSMEALDVAHELVATELGCRPTEVIFTGGGSEADNLAIKGIAYSARRRGTHIVTSAIEHHAVLHTCQQLEREGYSVTYVPADENGLVHVEDVQRSLTDQTALVTVMYVNNEVGTIQPVAEIGRLCRDRRIPFHVDAVQAGPLLDLNVHALNVDLLTLSAHKFYGPKGVGVLYARQGTRLQSQILGGSQERNRRAGTENVPGAVGAAEALRHTRANRADEAARLRALGDRLIAGVLCIPDVRLTGHRTLRLPGHASFAIAGVEGESLLLHLDLLGIAASSGSACTSGSVEPSHVLTAMRLSPQLARGHLRLTAGHSTTESDIEYVLDHLRQVIDRLRALSTRPSPVS